MCTSKSKMEQRLDMNPKVVHIDGRPVLQPTSNRVPILESRASFKKASSKTPNSLAPSSNGNTKTSPPLSPKLKSPRPPAVKRGNDPNGLSLSTEKVLMPCNTAKQATSIKKSKNASNGGVSTANCVLKYPSSFIVEAPGSIAAARREQVAMMQVQRKMKIAHYGRTKSAKYEGNVVPLDSSVPSDAATPREEKRCSFITHNSDFRDAFSGFDAEVVAKYTEKKITSIIAQYGFDSSLVRGLVDNSNRILEISKAFGSFDKYLWGFVNHKPIRTQYKSCHKIPVKTSKSESISKDMVRRGFRQVGPTVIHSFMQAAGLTNDHLISCPRHLIPSSTA
ncbi:Methyladenine glycosylase [Dillenia turbinata]|uniref:Methyladenine glycosylase n=1 Tax=Dillenia turbinata TaxID=194707 RepID=A0AAN8UHL2_9MAGN